MAKLRFEAIALLAIATLGFVLYASTSIATFESSFYLDANNNWDIFQRVNPFGRGKTISDGIILGMPFEDSETFTAADLSDFNHGTWVFALIGFILALASGVLYLIDNKKIPKYLCLILGVLGGVMMATSPLFVFNWVDFSPSGTKLGAAFFIGIIFGVLVLASSLFLFVYQPKKAKA